MKPLLKRHYGKKEKITVSIRLPQDLKDQLEDTAKDLGRSFADFVQEGLDQWAFIHSDKKNSSK